MISETTPPAPAAACRAGARTALIGVGLGLVAIVFAASRWSGQSPFGSDNDEYRLLADAIQNGSAEIAGVEGTKYPVGYSTALAVIDQLGLPVTGTALIVNVALVAVLSVLVWRLVPERAGRVGAATAVAVVLTSAIVWDGAYTVMPDVAFVVVATAILYRVGRALDTRAVVVLVGLVAMGALLKSVGILLGVAVTVPLFLAPRWRRWSWGPAAVGVVLTGMQALWSGRYPTHTTGYSRVFWLADQYDASKGTIGPLDLPARVIERLDHVLTEGRVAVFGPELTSGLVTLLAVALVLVAVLRLRERWAFTVPFLALYTVFLAAWPYDSPRFGLVYLPYAAIGAGIVVGEVARRTHPTIAIGLAALLLVPYGIVAQDEVERRGDREEAQLTALYPAIDEAGAWLDEHVGDGEEVASLDYRELAYRTDRTYVPLGYTSDTDQLWADSHGEGARWLVAISGATPSRDAVVDRFVTARPDQIAERAAFGPVTIYELTG